jgi:hypothetical protein
MTTSKKLLIALLATVGLATQVFAHHSTRGIYHEDQELELTGTVKEWAFINPHPYLTLAAPDANGVMRDWDISYGGAAVVHLGRQGYTKDTFAQGETIIVKGHPARKEGVYGLLMEGGGNIPTREDGTPVVKGGSMF